MKYLLFLILIIAFAVFTAYSQKSKPKQAKAKRKDQSVKSVKPAAEKTISAAPAAGLISGERKPEADELNKTSIGEWGVASLLIPANLTVADHSANVSNDWGAELRFDRYSWKNPSGNPAEAMTVELLIFNWKGRVADVRPDFTPEQATPEHMTSLALISQSNAVSDPRSLYIEAKMMPIDGLSGAYSFSRHSTEAERFVTEWIYYRYYKDNLQSINFKITGGSDQTAKALKILNSLKFD